jgi:signal peptidase I
LPHGCLSDGTFAVCRLAGWPPHLLMYVLNWFASRSVRHAAIVARQVERLVNEQRDLLSPEAVQAICREVHRLRGTLRETRRKGPIQERLNAIEAVASERLLPYPNPSLRENVKEVLVAVTIILAFTTFFLQLTKIPTGSMQPTLFGITHEDMRGDPDFRVPHRLVRWAHFWTKGIAYHEIITRSGGVLRSVDPPRLVFPFVRRQRVVVGDEVHILWFPPDQLAKRAALELGQYFRPGEPVVRLRVVSGDHLLVDRISYNFRRPTRGEIIVFKTRGILELPQDQLYIKRLVALPGEGVRIGDDQHLVIDGFRLDASVPRFENIYTFPPQPREHSYFGHVNDSVGRRYNRPSLAPKFRTENDEFLVGPRHYLAMGDNTLDSLDSRAWGDVPRENVIGRYWFVYWPFTERFGWAAR